MTQNEIDMDWSRIVAEDIADELVAGKVVTENEFARAVAIASQMIHIHLVSGDRPDSANRRYRHRNSN
jgi:hypothetical protein